MLIILAFVLINKGYLLTSGVISIISITVRQTNAVWVVYICCWKFIDINRHKFLNKDPRLSYMYYIQCFINLILSNLTVIVSMFKVHILGVVSMIMFIIYNGKIVLGDQEHHKPVQHWTQLLYFHLFAAIQLPLTIQQYYQLSLTCIRRLKQSQNALTTAIVLFLIQLYIVHQSTYKQLCEQYSHVHPFILADNRHYIFYIYKNFFARFFYFKYAIVILYTSATIFIFRLITNTQDKILTLSVLIFCTSITIIPAELVEFRYFTVALMFLYNEIKITPQISNWKSSINFTVLGYLLSNILFMVIFIGRPFICQDNQICRFMF